MDDKLLIERIKSRAWHVQNLSEVEPDAQVVQVSEVVAIIEQLSVKLTETAQELAELKVSKFKSLVESQQFYANK